MRLKDMSAFLCLFGVLLFPVFAGTSGEAQRSSTKSSTAKPAVMTNDDVIGLASAGMGDDIILTKIHAASATAFDTSVDGLKALKAAGVSSTVIRVMIDPAAAPAAAALSTAPPSEAATPVASNPDDPATVHAPGIYMLAKGADGQMHLNKLEHVVPKQAKSSGAYFSALTYGITKAKVRVVIDGPKASLEVTDTNPSFYAYIPEDNNTFGGSAISIKDFSLVKFDVKSDSRTVITGTGSIWGTSAGTDQKAIQGFSSEVVKPGIYKLLLAQPLPVGEYAFQQSGNSGSSSDQKNTGSYFDFGITPAS